MRSKEGKEKKTITGNLFHLFQGPPRRRDTGELGDPIRGPPDPVPRSALSPDGLEQVEQVEQVILYCSQFAITGLRE